MIRYTDINTGNNYLDEGVEGYLIHGLHPGGFLTSVLANDLYLAIGRADHWNKNNLPTIVDAVLREAPEIAVGSYLRVKDWINDKDGRRTAYAERKKKEYTWKVLKGEVRVKEFQDPPF